MKQILITGGTGFIGRHLLLDLAPTDYVIKVLSRNESKTEILNGKEITFVKGDLTDKESLIEALQGIDILIHLAAELKDENNFNAINVEGVKNILLAAEKNDVSKIIHLSSVGVLGVQHSFSPLLVLPTTQPSPKNNYERSKLESEWIWLQSIFAKNNKLIIIRPTNVYGDYHPRKALLGFLEYIQEGKTVYCTKGTTVNYVYVKDLTAFICSRLEVSVSKAIYQVGNSITMIEFCGIVAKELAQKVKIKQIPAFIPGLLSTFSFIFGNRMKLRAKAISNQVVYDDHDLQLEFKYPFGYRKGIEQTIGYYKNEKLLK